MKIISKTKDGYLVDITSTEIAMLTENTSPLVPAKSLKLGSFISVCDRMNQVNNACDEINRVKHVRSLKKNITIIQLELRRIADNIEPIKKETERTNDNLTS